MLYLRVHLKVCEGCGSLWFRSNDVEVYCGACTDKLRDFPSPRTRTRPGGRRKRGSLVTAAEACGGVR